MADCKVKHLAVQVPENADDKDLISAARDIMQASAQKFKLTYLSCKKDMSTLLSLSAIQVKIGINFKFT